MHQVNSRSSSIPVLRRSSCAGVAVLAWCAARGAYADVPLATNLPAGNLPTLSSEPPRPAMGDATDRARVLFQAILNDTPDTAADFYLPQDAFAQIKGISDPDSLWRRIRAAYTQDIHNLHAQLAAMPGGSSAEFVRLRFTGHRAWVRVREESNRLPYWAQRHSFLVFRIGRRNVEFEVRTMIAWNERWYITHLSEFRQATR